MADPRLVLGIESSCDETAVALLADGRHVRADRISTQIALHQEFGGVVPELASRRHLEVLEPLVRQALADAGAGLADLTGIAVTRGPGLKGALLVGLSYAKALAWALGVPLVGVHHLEAHIWANVLADPDLAPPFVCLLVSGGHTSLVEVRGPRDFRLLGETRDDAAGEAFDKVARLLDLGYPGGPVIDRLAAEGDPRAFSLPRAQLEGLDFSFSGVKTAVLRLVERHRNAGMPFEVADLAASFQQAVVDVLVARTMAAAEQVGATRVAVAGGVAANRQLRAAMGDACARRGWHFSRPPAGLCTDNAVMIAALGDRLLREGAVDGLDLGASSRLPLAEIA